MKHELLIRSLVGLMCLTSASFSYGQHVLDSLFNEGYAKTAAQEYDEAIRLFNEVVSLAEKKENYDLFISASDALVSIDFMRSHHYEAEAVINKVLNRPDLIPQDKTHFLMFLSSSYSDRRKLDSAIIARDQAISVYTEHQDVYSNRERRIFLKDISDSYYSHNQLDSALTYALWSQAFQNEENTLNSSSNFLYLAKLYYAQGNMVLAEKNAQSGLEASLANDTEFKQSQAYHILGNIQSDLGNYEQGLVLLKKSMELHDFIPFQVNKLDLEIDIALCNAALNNPSILLDRTIPSSDFDKIKGTPLERRYAMYKLLKLGATTSSLEEFRKEYDRVYAEFNANENLFSKKRLLEIKLFFERKVNSLDATETSMQLFQTLSAIRQENERFRLEQLEAEHLTKEQEIKIDALESQGQLQNELIEAKDERLKHIWIALGVFGVLLCVVLWLFMKNRKQNIDLKLKNLENAKLIAEKDVLLKEINHRVKNNLQLISSLLGWKARESKNLEVKAAFEEGKSKIAAVWLVHQNLYSEDASGVIQFKPYAESLIKHVSSALAPAESALDFDLSLENIELSISTAISIGLVLNELITNVLKYGATYPSETIAKITSFNRAGMLHVEIRNLTKINSVPVIKNFGLNFVESIVHGMDGQFTIDLENDEFICSLSVPV